ncbi:MAG: NAD(P)H-hydrate dehydratase [Clostridiales bacterium]|nr:NAD(P)H-hydrate dehydratase [Clostridiales bacterium]
MEIITAAQMREIDRRAIEDFGIPGIVLMENAGLRIVETVRTLPCTNVVILAGRGNNGGDGFVAARHLRNEKNVSVWMTAEPQTYQGDARTNLMILQRLEQPLRVVRGEEDLADLAGDLAQADLVVDGLLGTGVSRQVDPLYAGIIRLVNRMGVPVVAIDIPSGVCADTGKILGSAIRASITVTFALPKQGLLFFPGAACTGRLEVADIGIPPALVTGYKFNLLTSADMVRLLPPRPSEGHKGTFGSVLLVAGSRGMSGAAALSARAALRGGCGMVYAAIPESIQPTLAAQTQETVTLPLPENRHGRLKAEALDMLREKWAVCQVVAAGPGLSRDSDVMPVLAGILRESRLPVVLDADALNLLAKDPSLTRDREGSTLLTPHPGEAARLLNTTVEAIQSDRLGVVRHLAERYHSTVVLKGAHTLIADPSGEISLNVTGNNGMGTAGSGDVLTGLAAALLAQRLTVPQAARLAVYIHGLAGDHAAAVKGERALMAGDIIEEIPKAYLELTKIHM